MDNRVYIIRNDKTFVGIADNLSEAKILASDDADDYKISQVLARGFIRLFKKSLIKLDHPHYKFLKVISSEVIENEVF